MEIAVSTGLYHTKTAEEILDVIAGTSCKNIELFMNEAFMDLSIEELEAKLEARRLRITSIHTPLDFIAFKRRESEAYWIEKCILIASHFNVETIVTHMVNGGNENVRLHRENILKFGRLEEVRVTTENLPNSPKGSFLSRYDELESFIKENELNMTLDVTHLGVSKLPLVESYERLKKHIRNIHLSDYKDGAEHKILGQGELPLKTFINNLKHDSYQGNLTLEFDFDNKKRNEVENSEMATLEIEKSLEFIKECLK